MPTQVAQEELGRLYKAIALADFLQACGITAQDATAATAEEWASVATAASQQVGDLPSKKVNPPSEETVQVVLQLLMDREARFRQFGVMITKASVASPANPACPVAHEDEAEPLEIDNQVVTCNECGSDEVYEEPFDFGRCPETGYHDAGVMIVCRKCGHKDQL